MVPRKNKPSSNAAPETERFRADDIVRAIEAVERSGLTVRGVEITKNGSIKIETEPRKRQSTPAAAGQENANEAETAKKKQA